jgi:hypothetical protein
MSCLYSSPEVTSVELLAVKLIALKLQALNCRHRRLVRSGTPHARPDRSAVRFHTDFAVRRRQQRRVPQQSSGRRWLHQSFRLPKQAQVFTVAFQAQYQAFVRFAVKAAQLSKAIALNQDLRFGTFHSGRALALRTLASTRSIYGASNPGPML